MQDILLKIIGFIIVTGILVTIHEFGHFWVARKMGVKVLRFSVGFGKPLFKWTRKKSNDDTEYVVAAIPLGGYVKMLDEREGDVPEDQLSAAFNRQSLGARSAIVAAGPIFNLLFAILAFWGVLVLGEVGLRPLVGGVTIDTPAANAGFVQGDEILRVNDAATPTWTQVLYAVATASVSGQDTTFLVKDQYGTEHNYLLPAEQVGDFAEVDDPLKMLGLQPDVPVIPAILGDVLPGMPAEAAGLKTGDRVIQADAEAIEDWVAWVKFIRARPSQLINLTVEREGQLVKLHIIPETITSGGKEIGRIGAANQAAPELWAKYRVTHSMGLFEAMPAAVVKTWDFSTLTLKVMWRIATGQASMKNLGGPLTVASAAGQSMAMGLTQFLKLLAIISVSLGVLNLLPIPVLDGGHLFYFLIEAITRKPVPEKMMLIGQQIGLVLLLALMSLVMYQDILRISS